MVTSSLRAAGAGLLAWGALASLPAVSSAAPVVLVGAGSGLTAPTGIAEAPDGSLWVADEHRGVCRLGSDDRREPVASPFCDVEHAGPVAAAGLVFDHATRAFYAGDSSSRGGAIWRLRWDARTGTIDSGLPIARMPQERVTSVALLVASDPTVAGDVLFATKDSTAIMRLSVTGSSTLPPAPRTVGHAGQPGPTAIAAAGNRVYVADGGDVSSIDMDRRGPAERIAGLAGGMTGALAVDHARGRLYAGTANGLDDRVNVLEISTGALSMYERGFAGVTALAVDGGGDLLVADDPGVGMGVLDAEGHGRLWRVPVRSVARPSVRVDAAPAGVSPSTQARFAYSSSTGSTFECRLDGAPWSVCPGTGSGQSDYTDLSDGVHEFEVRAVNADQAGVSARRVFVVDTRAPRVWIAAPESGRTILGRPVTVELLADEARVDFMCSLDGSEFAFCGSTQILEGLSAGDHELRVRGLDAAGNVSDDQAPGTHWAFHTAAPAPVAAPATVAPATPAAVPVPATTPAPEVHAAAPVAHATRRPTRRTRPGRPIGVKVTATRVAPARGGRALRLRVSFRAPARAQAVHVTLEADGRRIAARRARVRGGANTVVLRLTAAEARRAHSGILRATVTVADRAGRVGAASSVPVRIA